VPFSARAGDGTGRSGAHWPLRLEQVLEQVVDERLDLFPFRLRPEMRAPPMIATIQRRLPLTISSPDIRTPPL
jgi:hypothetical protein